MRIAEPRLRPRSNEQKIIFFSHTGLVRSPRTNDGMTFLYWHHHVRQASLFDVNGKHSHGWLNKWCLKRLLLLNMWHRSAFFWFSIQVHHYSTSYKIILSSYRHSAQHCLASIHWWRLGQSIRIRETAKARTSLFFGGNFRTQTPSVGSYPFSKYYFAEESSRECRSADRLYTTVGVGHRQQLECTMCVNCTQSIGLSSETLKSCMTATCLPCALFSFLRSTGILI